jgi:hypothetical protein
VEEAAKQRKIPARVHHLLEMELGLENGTCNARMSVAGHGENERAWKCGNKNFLLRGGSLLQVVANKVRLLLLPKQVIVKLTHVSPIF